MLFSDKHGEIEFEIEFLSFEIILKAFIALFSLCEYYWV